MEEMRKRMANLRRMETSSREARINNFLFLGPIIF